MSSSSDDIFALLTSRVVVPIGATASVFMDILPGEKSMTIKYLSGGTLEILPAYTGLSLTPGGTQLFGSLPFTSGGTQTGAMLLALSGTGYLMGSSEVLNFDGAPRFYLSSLGATSVVAVIRACAAGI